jgi:hypothetical protein
MKKNIVIILSLLTLGCQASPNYNLAAKNCLGAQLEIGNEFIGLNAEGETLISLSVRTYESKPLYILGLNRFGEVTSNAGPISICHIYGNRVAVAFYEYGEFGLYGKNRKVYIESPSLTINDIQSENFQLKCAVSIEKNIQVDCSTKKSNLDTSASVN